MLAVPWRNVKSALKGLPAWNGLVLIDATHPFIATRPRLVLADLGGTSASGMVYLMAVVTPPALQPHRNLSRIFATLLLAPQPIRSIAPSRAVVHRLLGGNKLTMHFLARRVALRAW